MKKFLSITIYIFILMGCKSNKPADIDKTCVFSKSIDNSYTVREKVETFGKFGDCKLIEFQNEVYIVANLDSELHIKKANDKNAPFQVTNPVVSSSWLDVIEDNGVLLCVTASFHDKSLRLYKIEMESLKVQLITIVHKYDDQLLIDPTLLKVDDKYLITYTQIKGNVNNGDTAKPNGHYEVVLLDSNDLINWKKVSSIVSEDTNIEDGFLYFEAVENALFFLYEEEVFDKKRSAIKIKKSNDGGVHWDEPVTLLQENADQEPAAIFRCNENNYLFYSSDVGKPSASYWGAKGYIGSFSDSNFTPDQIDNSLDLGYGIILYDVMLHNGKIHFLSRTMRKEGSGSIVYSSFE